MNRFACWLPVISLLWNVAATGTSLDTLNAAPVRSVDRESNRLVCVHQPTTRVGLAANLDPDGPPLDWGFHPFPARFTYESQIEIHDLVGEPTSLYLQWFPAIHPNSWTFRVDRSPFNIETTPWVTGVPLFRSPGPVALPDNTIRFDEHGELVEPTELRIAIPSEDGRDQEIVFVFETRRGRTTQYAWSFIELDVEHDGIICPEQTNTRGACGVAPESIAEPLAQNAESIHFSQDGVLLSNRLERVQGYQLDLSSGARDEATSDARLPRQLTPPAATERARLVFEVDASAAIPEEDPRLSPSMGYARYTIPFGAFDSLGRHRSTQVHLHRVAPDRWRWYGPDASIPSLLRMILQSNPTTRRAKEMLAPHGGELWFDEQGVLRAVTEAGRLLAPGEAAQFPVGGFRWFRLGGQEPARTIDLDFGVGHTRLGAMNRVLEIDVDGNGAGIVSAVSLTGDGQLVGVSSSGVRYALSQLAPRERGQKTCSFECSNGRDDDRDGGRDFGTGAAPGWDRGCSSPLDASERSPRWACDDGRDNDLDGTTDFPRDLGCRDPLGTDEGAPDRRDRRGIGKHPSPRSRFRRR